MFPSSVVLVTGSDLTRRPYENSGAICIDQPDIAGMACLHLFLFISSVSSVDLHNVVVKTKFRSSIKFIEGINANFRIIHRIYQGNHNFLKITVKILTVCQFAFIPFVIQKTFNEPQSYKLHK